MKDNAPVERLLETGVLKCDGITGEEIAEEIQCLSKVGLDTDKCRSQTYHGAGNMAGKQRGAANQFQLKTGNMKATYFHLALSKASKIYVKYIMWYASCNSSLNFRHTETSHNGKKVC